MGIYKITTFFGQAPNLLWWRLQYMTDAEIAAYNRNFMKEVEMDKSEKQIIEIEQEHEKEVWNAAIEAAAKHCCTICKASENIRKLKK